MLREPIRFRSITEAVLRAHLRAQRLRLRHCQLRRRFQPALLIMVPMYIFILYYAVKGHKVRKA